jgi:hypothetical protein
MNLDNDTLKDIDVFGANINIVFESFGSFTIVASSFLLAEGIGKASPTGEAVVDQNSWYPLKGWLGVFERIREAMGGDPLHRAGLAVPRNAVFPPHVKGIRDALGSLDIAYHMNHRNRGEVMFDPNTGSMLEGIGHYDFRAGTGNTATMICTNPYPCEFDKGIITSVAQRFESKSTVVHEDRMPCRKSGGAACTYTIKW